MRKSGAELTVFALEQIGVKYTYGIPGTHTTEIYDQLNDSKQIKPILVTHEGGGSFMADASSRTSDGIGCLMIVPAAGTTHAMSGIGEAFLDGIPMLVITGGTRRDSGRHYQLHQIDQAQIVKAVTKAQFLIENHDDIIPTIYEAYNIAISGEPGPVFIEIPIELQMFTADVKEMSKYQSKSSKPTINQNDIDEIIQILENSTKPMLYVGWGAMEAFEYTIKLAELLGAPVATTLQGKSAFPNNHPLYTSVGVGASSKPSGQWALKEHDSMLAVGVRFSEISTGSYGLDNPKNLIHIDINSEVFNKNYQAVKTLEADGKEAIKAIYDRLVARNFKAKRDIKEVEQKLTTENDKYFNTWLTEKKNNIVSPGHFFKALRAKVDQDAMMVTDDGKHTFLSSELFPVNHPRHFISPTDFNCMGYCVPASIAVKLNNPDKQVIAIIGDGAMLMTGLELITAKSYGISPIFFIFNDGELGQISQFQSVPLNRKTCTVLSEINFEGIAIAAGIEYLPLNNDLEIDSVLDKAIALNKQGKAILVDVNIDYSKKTMLTKGVIKVNLGRFPLRQKVRFLTRAVKRHITG
ncbi:MAG TPA: thiamine pyrophosphate-binding protein [Chitinophagales bacterium]|nr:thiamine pyrophosphate-binding protein [Chitinophagales bacterium]